MQTSSPPLVVASQSILHPESVLYKDVQYVKRIKKNALNQIRHKRHLYELYKQYEKDKMLDFLSNFIVPLQKEPILFSNGLEISSFPSHFSIFESMPQTMIQNGIHSLVETASLKLQSIFEKSDFIQTLQTNAEEQKEEDSKKEEFEYEDASDTEVENDNK